MNNFEFFSMIFTQGAMQKMAKSCSCPNVDSPDDMIIGKTHISIKSVDNGFFYFQDHLFYLPDSENLVSLMSCFVQEL